MKYCSSYRAHIGKALVYLTVVSLALGSLPVQLAAETFDFGGHDERFKGGGDKIPPRCQIEVPRAATSAFFVRWNCIDDNAAVDEIRSELWLYRKDAPRGELIGSFLGFPASVRIDEEVLGVGSFVQGLPIQIRLLARDRAGIGLISPFLTVKAQDASFNRCSLSITTEATEATETTTGVPSLSAIISDVPVNAEQTNGNSLNLQSVERGEASPCEIVEVCSDNESIGFSLSATTNDLAQVNGTLVITPPGVRVEVEGTASAENSLISSISLSGETELDGLDATVQLSCSE